MVWGSYYFIVSIKFKFFSKAFLFLQDIVILKDYFYTVDSGFSSLTLRNKKFFAKMIQFHFVVEYFFHMKMCKITFSFTNSYNPDLVWVLRAAAISTISDSNLQDPLLSSSYRYEIWICLTESNLCSFPHDFLGSNALQMYFHKEE